ncbi:hypothetical protein QVD17_30303 [Tagetes erecta]|uniref:RRM domain-containing protein n=1 Tax=Tagetes erecta TaxID=13708 RepID=A0AAD8NMV9_TARER|nr:hypothetical protein QVD17_30303 [Tagetes erecta]
MSPERGSSRWDVAGDNNIPQSEAWIDEDKDGDVKASQDDGGGWNKVGSKKTRRQHDILSEGLTVTFFAAKLPVGCTSEMLRVAFGKHGKVVEAYIAKKKDNRKNSFAFISFTDVPDMKELENNLNGLVVGGVYLSVNLARFDKFGQKLSTPGVVPGRNHDRVLGNDRPPNNIPPPTSRTPCHSSVGRPRSGLSFKEALAGKSNSSKFISVALSESKASISWKGTSLIGSAWDIRSICTLRLLDGSPRIRYITGLSVLLSFNDAVEARTFLLNKASWLPWFSMMEPWVGQTRQYERVAWLRIFGVPLNLWDPSVFNQIGGQFGRVIQPSQLTPEDDSLSSDFVGVMVSSPKKINTELTICWNNSFLQVGIEEESGDWTSEFLLGGSNPFCSSNDISGSSSSDDCCQNASPDDEVSSKSPGTGDINNILRRSSDTEQINVSGDLGDECAFIAHMDSSNNDSHGSLKNQNNDDLFEKEKDAPHSSFIDQTFNCVRAPHLKNLKSQSKMAHQGDMELNDTIKNIFGDDSSITLSKSSDSHGPFKEISHVMSSPQDQPTKPSPPSPTHLPNKTTTLPISICLSPVAVPISNPLPDFSSLFTISPPSSKLKRKHSIIPSPTNLSKSNLSKSPVMNKARMWRYNPYPHRKIPSQPIQPHQSPPQTSAPHANPSASGPIPLTSVNNAPLIHPDPPPPISNASTPHPPFKCHPTFSAPSAACSIPRRVR